MPDQTTVSEQLAKLVPDKPTVTTDVESEQADGVTLITSATLRAVSVSAGRHMLALGVPHPAPGAVREAIRREEAAVYAEREADHG